MMPSNKCRVCGNVNDDAMATNGKDVHPVEGNLSLCLYCSTLAVYNADGTLRDPSMEEMLSMAKDPNIRAAVVAACAIQRDLRAKGVTR